MGITKILRSLTILVEGVLEFTLTPTHVRDPGSHHNRGWLIMGRALSLPMILFGGALLTYTYSVRVRFGNFAVAQ